MFPRATGRSSSTRRTLSLFGRAATEVTGDPGEDVRLSIEQTSEWIRSADTKTGLLGAALAIVVSIIPEAVTKQQILDTFDSARGFLVGAALVTMLSALVMAGYFMMRVLVPRLNAAAGGSRFSWPWVAQRSVSQLLALEPQTARAEAWSQARTLALIARDKHRSFAWALRFSAVAVSAFLVWRISIP